MKILHLYRTFFPESQGGLEEAILQIAKNTSKYGVESIVLVPCDEGERRYSFQGVTVQTFKRHGEVVSCDWSLTALPIFREMSNWADLVNVHFPWPYADLLLLLSRVQKPYVVTYHSDIVRQKTLMRVYQPFMTRTLRRAQKIIATSPRYAESSPVLKAFSEKVCVIPLGLSEPEEFGAQAEQLSDFSRPYVLFVGVLRYYKSLEYLVDAAYGAGFDVVIAGDGPERDRLETQARNLNLNNVSFLGRISDQEKYSLFQGCSAVVLPSAERSEAFGVTLIEGAMCSKPLISCEIETGTSYVNLDGVTGLVVKRKNAEALRNAIDSIVFSEDAIKSFGAAARQRYEELFSGDALGAQYADLYRFLLN